VKAVESDNPPLRLLSGVSALKSGQNKLKELQKDYDTCEDITIGAGHPKE
jgi:hypothetical protein